MPLSAPLFVSDFQASGYYTGLVGKYLNSWGIYRSDQPHPAFAYWVAHGSLDGGGDYFHPELNINGEWQQFDDYFTCVVRDFALDFLHEAEADGRPFLLVFTPYAPHSPATPAPGDDVLYPELPPYRPPSFNYASTDGLPKYMADRPLLDTAQIDAVDRFRLQQIQSLNAVDDAINEMLDYLASTGELDNTIIIFTSDNGLAWGEHRVSLEKNLPYEESVHMPFAVRYPSVIPEYQTSDTLVANIDIAPTLYDLADIEPSYEMDGLSLVPVLHGKNLSRDHLLIETFITIRVSTVAVHTGETTLIETRTLPATSVFSGPLDFLNPQSRIEYELYDLVDDPYQLSNKIGDPAYASVEAHLRQVLVDSPASPPNELKTSLQISLQTRLVATLVIVGLVAVLLALRQRLARSKPKNRGG